MTVVFSMAMIEHFNVFDIVKKENHSDPMVHGMHLAVRSSQLVLLGRVSCSAFLGRSIESDF